MTGLPDLTTLLYRADWTQLSLTGELIRRVDRAALGLRHAPSERHADPAGPHPADAGAPPQWQETTGSVLVAPGGRFRVANPARHDGPDVTVCDGESCWRLLGDWAERREAGLGDPALAQLLDPSWLLAGYVLAETGTIDSGGRTAYCVTATPRPVGRRGKLPDRVDVLVDAELGILLRLEARNGGRLVETAALESVAVHPDHVLDLTQFSPPPGTTPTDPGAAVADFGQLRGPLGQVVGTAADLTANALGFAVRHAPRPAETAPPPPMPVAAAEAEMASTDPLSNAEIKLLHRSGLPGQDFTAEVRTWMDREILMERAQRMRSSMRQPLTGVLGPDAVWAALAERAAGVDYRTARLRVAAPGRYRIDYLAGNWQSKLTTACDGERTQTLYGNRVVTGPAEPLDDDWALLADPAWLLLSDWQLSAAGEAVVDGRPGLVLRADAQPGPDRPVLYSPGWYPPDLHPSRGTTQFDRVTVVVDRELGIILRYTGYLDDRPAVCSELHEVQPCTATDPAEFTAQVPPGTRVVEGSSPLAHLDLRRPVEAAKAAGAIGMAGAAIVSGWLQNRPGRRQDSSRDR
jgi:outer membrane lipoprotein-sorting protein